MLRLFLLFKLSSSFTDISFLCRWGLNMSKPGGKGTWTFLLRYSGDEIDSMRCKSVSLCLLLNIFPLGISSRTRSSSGWGPESQGRHFGVPQGIFSPLIVYGLPLLGKLYDVGYLFSSFASLVLCWIFDFHSDEESPYRFISVVPCPIHCRSSPCFKSRPLCFPFDISFDTLLISIPSM